MKGVTIALLLANLIVFGWLYTHPQSQRPGGMTQTTALPASVEPLVLLRERAKDAAVNTEKTSPSSGPAVVPELPPAAQATVSQDNVQGNPTATETEQPVSPQTAEATDGSAAATDTAAAESAVTPAPDEGPAVAEPERICQSIGPFAVRAQADALVRDLSALGREPAVRASQIEEPSGYWVYLPSMPHTEAQRIIGVLSAKGVKDYFLGRQNFISLGVFSDKRSAEARVSDIAALGFAPRMEPRFLTREVFWVDLDERSPQRIEDAQWAALLKEQPDIRRQTVACE